MLLAQLHGKLSRLAERHLNALREGPGQLIDWDSAVRGDEDSLTSSVFSRLAYLDETVVAGVLDSGLVRLTSTFPAWPQTPLASQHFWPSLEAAPNSANSDRVEPDVIMVYRDHVMVIEVKWRATHSVDQWTSQLLAARLRWPQRNVHLLAVGDLRGDYARFQKMAHDVDAQLVSRFGNPRGSVACLDWHKLYQSLSELRGRDDLTRPQRAVVHDMCEALEHRNLRPLRQLQDLCLLPELQGSAVQFARWQLNTPALPPTQLTVLETRPASGFAPLIQQPAIRSSPALLHTLWRVPALA